MVALRTNDGAHHEECVAQDVIVFSLDILSVVRIHEHIGPRLDLRVETRSCFQGVRPGSAAGDGRAFQALPAQGFDNVSQHCHCLIHRGLTLLICS
ncbi:hypothetical protein D3C86_1692900 [compost metagenome]